PVRLDTFVIENIHTKFRPTEYNSQAALDLILEMRDLVPLDEIDRIDMETYWPAYSEIGSEPAKWDPRTRETADHSLPYLLAVALRDGAITSASFELERVLDPSLRPLMNKIRISEDEEFTRQFPVTLPSEIEVVTTTGERIVERSSYPKGHAQNPMSDHDVEAKFRTFSEPAIGPERCSAALDA